MQNANWRILNVYPSDPIRAILKSRKITNVEAFINPDYEKLVDPLKIPNLKKAVKRIQKAIVEKQKIGIFMDYDADGIPGGAIMFKTLKSLGAEVVTHVPKREDGYGLNDRAVKSFQQSGVSLLLTIDCGIRNNKEIEYAKKLGLETIVVDHHELGNRLPSSLNVHPLITLNNPLKFKDFSGGGVAFMLAKALTPKAGQEKWLLDLAAISSVADIVTLRDDNRLIVKFGLVVLNKTKNLGLQELVKIAGLKSGAIGTYEIGYMIAPRINAAGRISLPEKSLRLLTTGDRAEARELAQELNDLNLERQEILDTAQKQAQDEVIKNELYKDKIIIVKNASWPEGIIGLVAGKIAQTFWRPTIALNKREGLMKGSARSILGININELIGQSGEFLTSFGGHEQAAGINLQAKNFAKFAKSIQKNAEKFADEVFQKTLKIDALLEVDQLTLALAKKLQKLEPFGPGNPRPLIALENVKIKSARRVGRDQKHLRLEIEKSSRTHHVIAFYAEENGFKIAAGDIYDLAFTAKPGAFNGQEKLDLILESAIKK